MQKQTGTLQMTQKLMSKSGSFCRPFNQTRYVGNDETFFVSDTDDPQIGLQSRERVIRDFGASIGYG